MPVLFVVVLAVEVQLARMGAHLDDESGSRPDGLVIGAERSGQPFTMVWLGDSTSTGVGAEDFADSMAVRTAGSVGSAVDKPVSLTVLGVSGAQVHEVLDEQVGELSENTDLVLVSVGANDVTHLTRRPTFRHRYGRLVDAIADRAPEAAVVLVGVPDMGAVPRFLQPLRWVTGSRGDQLDDDVAALADRRGLRHVDLAAETGPVFRGDPSRYFADDDFHPNDEGHGVWADAVLDEAVAAAEEVVG